MCIIGYPLTGVALDATTDSQRSGFCDFVADPAYGWRALCLRTFNEVTIQICFEWNAPRHSTDDDVPPTRRAFSAQLATLVESDKMESIFGHNEAFEIRAIFGGNGGANLRNQSAHGLLSDRDEQSPYPFYDWWMTWKLIAEEFGNTERDATASANREPADPPDADDSISS